MNTIKILPFGHIAEITGRNPFVVEANDTDELRKILNERFPALGNKSFLLTVNKQVAITKTILSQHAEVALLPPFSGG